MLCVKRANHPPQLNDVVKDEKKFNSTIISIALLAIALLTVGVLILTGYIALSNPVGITLIAIAGTVFFATMLATCYKPKTN